MPKTNKKKICIVVSSLGIGGAERSSALLSQMLYELDFEIHIVSVKDKIDYPYKGTLLNLGLLKKETDSPFGRFKRFQVFKNYIKAHNFDYIIDSRTRIGFLKELLISKILYRSEKVIYNIHSYNTNLYIHPNPFFAKIIYSSAYRFVTVSAAIEERIKEVYSFKNTSVIYNAVNEDLLSNKHFVDEETQPYVLFFGRLDDDVKNLSFLLKAYSESNLPQMNVNLKILGDGDDLEMLKSKSIAMKLDDKVEFLCFNAQPFQIVKNALFTVLTSRYEGFPMVIVESLSLGVPVVSVDCMSGPNEIIKNEQNGLLVENHNVHAFANAMDRMLSDKDLYLQCNENAKSSVAKFSKPIIRKEWQALLK